MCGCFTTTSRRFDRAQRGRMSPVPLAIEPVRETGGAVQEEAIQKRAAVNRCGRCVVLCGDRRIADCDIGDDALVVEAELRGTDHQIGNVQIAAQQEQPLRECVASARLMGLWPEQREQPVTTHPERAVGGKDREQRNATGLYSGSGQRRAIALEGYTSQCLQCKHSALWKERAARASDTDEAD